MSVVSIGEIEREIARQPDCDKVFARVLAPRPDRILAVDLSVARRRVHFSCAIGADNPVHAGYLLDTLGLCVPHDGSTSKNRSA